ncbi:MAG: DUF4469 domain-containing protein [Treponema sp.]|jgi:hypothetical protein|nr:DUF4469 domain-containing protein [Treponema sp.]
MLEYCLEINELTSEPDDMRAQAVNVISHNQTVIIDRILKIGAGLTRSDVLSVLEAEKQVICEMLAEGGAVTTDLFNAFPSIQGVFSGVEDTFDHKRHRVKIHLSAGIGLRGIEEQVKTKKSLPGQSGAYITSVTDVKTGSVNYLLTPGRNLRINGSKLKLVGEDPSVGVYFIAADGSSVKVDSTDIAENKPSEVIVVIPALGAGSYTLRLITQYSGSSTLVKKPHTAECGAALTVLGSQA